MMKDIFLTKEKMYNDNLQKVIKGIPSSSGLVHGKVMVLEPELASLPPEQIPIEMIDDEIKRFDIAVNDLVQEFVSVLSKVDEESKSVMTIIESNIQILTDEIFLKAIRGRIKMGYSAENSLIQEFDIHSIHLKESKDTIIRERAFELDHIKERLLSALRNKCIFYGSGKNSIVVAQSLTPTDIIQFKDSGALGFITEVGGITAHASILARSYGIPMVIGVSDATSLFQDDINIIVDGYTGTIVANPKREAISVYISKKQKEQEHKEALGEYSKLVSITTDGRRIKLLANIDTPEDVENAIMFGADGIGLVRTEQLILSKNRIPDEEEQYQWYNAMAERIYPNPITIRAFDIGSDKFSIGLSKHEANPALGFRGIRFLLSRADMFKTQLKAILRASKNKNVRLMLPLITCFNQVEQSMSILNNCKQELENSGISYDKDIPIGIMIETPAAAIMAEKIAKYVDFFSLGTNDLTQYTLAVDRTNEFVASIYDSFHPSVLLLLQNVAKAAINNNIPVSICGELAGHSAATILLIGMGITELSVSPPIMLELKKRIREINYVSAKELADELLTISNCDKIRERLSIDN
jgi:phosphotransferase system enzyme I (PtsI)